MNDTMLPPSAPVRRPPTHLRRTALENPKTLLPTLNAGFLRLKHALEPRRRVLEQKMKANIATDDELDELDQGANLTDEVLFIGKLESAAAAGQWDLEVLFDLAPSDDECSSFLLCKLWFHG